MELALAVGTLSKILGAGISAWDAFKTPGFDDKDVAALRAFLDAGSGILGAAMSPKECEASALHLALITRSFGQAFGRHWAFNKDFVPVGKLSVFMTKEQKHRSAEIEARTRYAAQRLLVPGELPAGPNELNIVTSLTGSPLNTPYYRTLWDAFSNPSLDDESTTTAPLLDTGESVRGEFERNFLIVYWEGLSSVAGQRIRDYVNGLEKYQTRLVRELILKDTSAWGERHLFGNTDRNRTPQGYGLPFLPLDAMYVEPLGQVERAQESPKPILTLIKWSLRQPDGKLIFVKADFGSGKSLTARTLACRLAADILTTRTGTSTDQELPVFIRCADDFISDGAFELAPTVRRAWKRQASTFGLELKTSDDTLSPPEKDQKSVFILDGLDEVALSDRKLDALIQRLQEETSAKHRFIIFSRPGALPSEQKLNNAVVITLLPFTTQDTSQFEGGQVGEWLRRWSTITQPSTPLKPHILAQKNLLEIAKTPILLFMIAQSWDDIASTNTPKTLAEIYEGFFQHIAHGKHNLDREKNINVFEASNHLLEQLKSLNELPSKSKAPDAMLWLMSRVAWEATKLSQNHPSEPLTTRDVDRLIEDDLELRPSSELTSTIRMGLLLAMQADLKAGADHFLFGHKSFREFLVARYWANRLRKLASADSRDAIEIEHSLYGARFMAENEHLKFLIEILNQLKPTERSAIAKWTQACLNNEEQIFKARKDRPTGIIRDDLRAPLREAALAIGCTIKGGHIHIEDPMVLRSLIGWFVATETYASLHAPGVTMDNTNLWGVRLFYSSFVGSTLNEVELSDSTFGECDFSHSHILGGEMEIADFQDCSFIETTLTDLRITSRFSTCSFESAIIEDTVLEGSSFLDCDLTSANFEETTFLYVSFRGGNLSKTRFSGCIFEDVDFQKTNLSSVVFENTQYTSATTWPGEFNPAENSGLRLKENEDD